MICLTEWKRGGGGGCNFSMSDNAPTFRLVFFHGLEPYPYVAKGSYVSLYDTPSLVVKNKTFSPTGDARGFIKRKQTMVKRSCTKVRTGIQINQSIDNKSHPYLQKR